MPIGTIGKSVVVVKKVRNRKLDKTPSILRDDYRETLDWITSHKPDEDGVYSLNWIAPNTPAIVAGRKLLANPDVQVRTAAIAMLHRAVFGYESAAGKHVPGMLDKTLQAIRVAVGRDFPGRAVGLKRLGYDPDRPNAQHDSAIVRVTFSAPREAAYGTMLDVDPALVGILADMDKAKPQTK